MLLWQAMKEVREYEAEQVAGCINPAVILDVVTPEVGRRYGSEYQGQRVSFGGVHGRLADIPAYLGGEEVVSRYWDGDVLRVSI